MSRRPLPALPPEREPVPGQHAAMLYESAVQGRRDFRAALVKLRAEVREIVERSKLRGKYQNSFIETDDLLKLRELVGGEIGKHYRYNDPSKGEE